MASIPCLNSLTSSNENWILDIGVTNQICCRNDWLSGVRVCSSLVQMPNGTHSFVVGIGSFSLGS